jgi:hypothetical protein
LFVQAFRAKVVVVVQQTGVQLEGMVMSDETREQRVARGCDEAIRCGDVAMG